MSERDFLADASQLRNASNLLAKTRRKADFCYFHGVKITLSKQSRRVAMLPLYTPTHFFRMRKMDPREGCKIEHSFTTSIVPDLPNCRAVGSKSQSRFLCFPSGCQASTHLQQVLEVTTDSRLGIVKSGKGHPVESHRRRDHGAGRLQPSRRFM